MKKISHIIQFILALYVSVVSIGSLVLYVGPMYPFYMTQISIWILTFYMVFYFWLPRLLRTVLYGFLLSIHVIVPTVFWIFLRNLVSDTRQISIIWNYLIHGSDFVVIFLHFLLFRNELPMWTIATNVLFGFFYLAWAWAGVAITGQFVYPFLNPNDEMAKFLYPGLFIGIAMLSFGWCKIHQFRAKRAKVNFDSV